MSAPKISIRAGRRAYELLSNRPLTPELIAGVAVAAGGPKWFTTYGLVRYIINDLLADDLSRFYIGSSVGSWQMAAACTADPGGALDRLKKAYAEHIYTEKPNADEISNACADMIRQMVSDQTDHILNHQTKRLYVTTSRGRGMCNTEQRSMLLPGLALAAIGHTMKRSWLQGTMRREIFSNHISLPYNTELDTLKTKLHPLNSANLVDAMTASGAIPLLMRGITMTGTTGGIYWDGGIVDYHMAYPYDRSDGKIVLLPHFMHDVLVGWFDKHLPMFGKAKQEFMSDVLVVYPSEDYVRSLPRQQISTMDDFDHFGQDQQGRIAYWDAISSKSLDLGAEFKERIESDTLREVMRPY